MDPIMFEHHLPSRKQRIRDARRDKDTLDMFAAPAVKSATSKAAAKSISGASRGKLQGQVLTLLRSAGHDGLARFQIAEQLHKYPNEITSTVDALITRGLLYETTRKVINDRTRQEAFVVVAAEYYRDSSSFPQDAA